MIIKDPLIEKYLVADAIIKEDSLLKIEKIKKFI